MITYAIGCRRWLAARMARAGSDLVFVASEGGKQPLSAASRSGPDQGRPDQRAGSDRWHHVCGPRASSTGSRSRCLHAGAYRTDTAISRARSRGHQKFLRGRINSGLRHRRRRRQAADHGTGRSGARRLREVGTRLRRRAHPAAVQLPIEPGARAHARRRYPPLPPCERDIDGGHWRAGSGGPCADACIGCMGYPCDRISTSLVMCTPAALAAAARPRSDS
jgi:hypothetical protein